MQSKTYLISNIILFIIRVHSVCGYCFEDRISCFSGGSEMDEDSILEESGESSSFQPAHPGKGLGGNAQEMNDAGADEDSLFQEPYKVLSTEY